MKLGKTLMSQCSRSLGEGVETFQIGTSEYMFHPDFIQAGTGESVHGGDFALIFLNGPSAYQV